MFSPKENRYFEQWAFGHAPFEYETKGAIAYWNLQHPEDPMPDEGNLVRSVTAMQEKYKREGRYGFA